MEKIIVDLKKILSVGKAVSTESGKYILHGVLIKDFEKNGQFYRDYVATDGRIMLIERETRICKNGTLAEETKKNRAVEIPPIWSLNYGNQK